MILPYFVLIPLTTAILITILCRNGKRPAAILGILASATLLALAVVSFITLSKTGETLLYNPGKWNIPLAVGMVVDYLASFMLIVVNLVALTASIYAMDYMDQYTDPWNFFALFMLMLTGMNGFIITGDMFNLFVFMEIALLSAYSLVGFGGRAEEFEASFKYTVIGSLSSMFILLAIGILYAMTSTLNMADIGRNLAGSKGFLINFVYCLLLAGFGLKAALVPFHAWLPDAHSSAPTPVSAMLSGVLVKTLGVYALIRIFYHVLSVPQGIFDILLILGTLTIVLSALIGRLQFDLKRLLAYSSISQVGYIILGLGLGTPLGILGAMFHLFNHGLMKSLLFFNAGTIEYATGTRDLREMSGIDKKLRTTAITSMIASLSISGVPPLGGFFSKVIIILAAIQAQKPVYGLIAALASILTLSMFLKVQKSLRQVDNSETQKGMATPQKVPFSLNAAMIFLGLLCSLSVVMIIPGIKESFLDKVVGAIQNRQAYLNIIPEVGHEVSTDN